MKKRNLIIANTYFQLITAINIVINNLKDDLNDIIITDISVGSESKAEKLKNLKIFHNVYYITYKELNSGNKIKKYIKYLFNRKTILHNQFSTFYDDLIFYNLNILTYSLIDELYKYNKNLVCFRYDEGFVTYTINLKNNNFNNIIRVILGKTNINKLIKRVFLYHPKLVCYEHNYQIVSIPILDKKDIKLKNILNNVFDYKKINIPQKYIFLEESFFCDNQDINDYDLILKIANIVGKDNLIIKLHPRNKVNRFKDIGIHTWGENNIPWEVIQMNEDFHDKIILTISSNSLLASKLYFNEDIKSYYLFKCTNKVPKLVTNSYLDYLNKIKNTIGLDNIMIPNSEDELMNYLKKRKGE